MNLKERQELKQKIEEEIAAQKTLIASLSETSKPVAPDNAIGRLSRMEALNDRAVSSFAQCRPDQTVAVGNGIGQSGPARFRPLRQRQQPYPARPHFAHARGNPLRPLRRKELTGVQSHSFA